MSVISLFDVRQIFIASISTDFPQCAHSSKDINSEIINFPSTQAVLKHTKAVNSSFFFFLSNSFGNNSLDNVYETFLYPI